MPPRKFHVRVLPAAESDLHDIIEYIAAERPSAALRLAEKIESALRRLETHPLLGKLPQDTELIKMGYRYLIVENYLIFYTHQARTIFIHRILHGARDYKELL